MGVAPVCQSGRVKVGRLAVGIAGLGRFGRLHAAIVANHGSASVAAVFDPDPEAAERARRGFGNPVACASFEELLAFEGLDCIFIVSPEDCHETMLEQAIERGLPTFIEKPLALSSAKGRELADRAGERGVYLQVGFVVRFEARSAFLRDEIARGALGELVTVRAKRNCSRAWFDIYADRAHAVFETVIHDIDYLLWIAGSRCVSVYALERNLSGRRYPDATMALLRFESGLMAAIETSWLVPDRAPANVLTDSWHGTIDAELEIVGTRKSARLRVLESGLEIWGNDLSHHPEFGLWPEINGAIAGALKAEDEHFLHLVATGEPSTVTSVADAVEGLRIAEAIVESASRGQEIRL
jgi:predicted dehydrogenase